MNQMIEKAKSLLDIIFPRRCPVCGEVVAFGGELAHEKCRARLRYISEPVCLKCGKPILDFGEALCEDCARRRHQYDAGRAVWIYDGTMRRSIAAFKYHGRREYADFYAEQMWAVLEGWLSALRADVVIPVPLNPKKQRMRGYNQAALLAGRIAKKLNCPMDERYLRRTSWTEPQKELSPIQRYMNLKKAFHVSEDANKYDRVLLVDDIYTTGSTIDACAAVLRSAGVQRVYFASLCIGSNREG